MKKKITVIGLIIILTLTLCACGQKDAPAFNSNVTINQKNIFNNSKIRVDVVEQNFKDCTLRLKIKNNTNKDVTSGVLKSLVNNIGLSNTSGEDTIKKNKEKEVLVNFDRAEMTENKIGEVANIKLMIIFIDKNYNEVANTGYLNINTSSDYEQDLSVDGDEFFAEKGLTMSLAKTKIQNGNLIYKVQTLNENKKSYFINVSNVRLGEGEIKSATIYETIAPKSLSNNNLVISKQELAEYGLVAKDIKNTTIDVSVYDSDTYEKVASKDNIILGDY